MSKESGLEIKVGAFMVAAALALVAFVFSVSDFSVFEKGSEYSVFFQFANGLKKGAPVRLAGVDAGHVRDMVVFYDAQELKTRVRVNVWMKNGTMIPSDSRVLINQLGLLGEKYVEILPGTAGSFLPPGEKLRGEDPIAMESIMSLVGGIAAKLETTLNGVNQKLLTEGNANALAESLRNFAFLSSSLRNGEGTIGKFLMDKSVYQNLDEMTADLKANPWKLFYRPKGSK